MMHPTLIRPATILLLLAIAAPMSAWSRPASVHSLPDAESAAARVWVVELEDAPSVEFSGGSRMVVASDGSHTAKIFAPTAPSHTGARRLDPRSPAVQRYTGYLDSRREAVLASARERLDLGLEPRFVYRHLRNGFAATMTDEQASRLEELPGVRSVRPDTVWYPQTDAGPQWIGAPALWTGSTGAPNPNRGEGMVLGVIDTGVNWESVFFEVPPGDTSITNPRGEFFGLCNDAEIDIPCSDKLIGVYDFTDGDTNGFDPDGHGSHTASTAVGMPLSFTIPFAGNDIAFQTSGVAPRASFIAYKACEEPSEDSATGNFICPGTATLAALEQALEDQVDAVNFSIGANSCDANPACDPWRPGGSREFLNLREAGIVPVVSGGNSGPDEASVFSPANRPWVVAVANATHGRILGNRVVDTSGGSSPLGELIGETATGGLATVRPIVHARDFGSALCGTGEPELGPNCADNTGASSPFEPGTFNGEIVVCDRGRYGRVEKSKNVFDAGAGGMILANTAQQGESINADEHCLPATHVGAEAGDRLRDWLAGGENHRGRLTDPERIVDANRAGLISDSSSRGPAVQSPNTMKPNLTAPGTNILAASTEVDEAGTGPGENASRQIAFLTGTSMSSPHVAGAALLLRAAQPEWGVDEIVSALETTADASIVRRSDGSPARVIDAGAGGAQVDRAAQIGLYLPVSRVEFINANPDTGGDPGSLNLPGIFSGNCQESCSFTRRVRALGTGTWTVSTEGALDIDVSPSSFTLADGGEQELEITIGVGDVPPGLSGDGRVVLESSNPDFVTQSLPVSARISGGSVPESLSFTAETNRGRDSLDLPDLAPVSEMVIRTSALVRPEMRSPTLIEDPTPTEPFDGSAGTSTELLEVDENAIVLFAETFASTSQDIDLFVGRDDNGNGQADEFEKRCSSISPDDLEFCRIDEPEAGTWWVRVQNWAAGDTSEGEASDAAPFEFAALAQVRDPSLVAFGPAVHAGGPLSIPVFWDQPAMRQDERWVGAVGLASSPDFAANIGSVLVDVTRTGVNAPVDRALFNERAEPIVIAAETEHRRVFIDVPPTAVAMDIDIAGDIDGATLRFLPFDALADSVPVTPPAPDAVLAESVTVADGREITLTAAAGETLQAGRYFVVLENDGNNEASLTLTASVTEAQRVQQRRGLWSAANRAIPIRQGLDWQVSGANSFAVWYTYDEAGLPTFYITDGVPQPDDSSFFSAVLFRVTSNGERQTPVVVGQVQVTGIAEDRFMYAWRLNGNHGAEMFDPINSTACPIIDGQPLQLLGHWFSPDTATGGATVLVTDQDEAWIRYYYDDTNQPRWVIADEELPATLPGGNRMEVLDFRGWCIYCEQTPITSEAVGTLERQFIDQTTAREVSDFVAAPPIDTSVDIDREISRLSNIVGCPNS